MGGVLRSLAVVRLAEAAVTFPKSRSCWRSRENGGREGRPWANERSGGQRWVGHQWAERSEGQGGHGLVAVAARVRQTQTDRRGKETKRAHKRGHKKKKDRRVISVS